MTEKYEDFYCLKLFECRADEPRVCPAQWFALYGLANKLRFLHLIRFQPARAWNLTHVFDIFIQSSNDILLGWHENLLFIWMDWMSKMLLFDRTLRRKRNVDSMKTDSAVNNFSSSSQQLLFIYSLACSVEYLQWQHFVFICLLA